MYLREESNTATFLASRRGKKLRSQKVSRVGKLPFWVTRSYFRMADDIVEVDRVVEQRETHHFPVEDVSFAGVDEAQREFAGLEELEVGLVFLGVFEDALDRGVGGDLVEGVDEEAVEDVFVERFGVLLAHEHGEPLVAELRQPGVPRACCLTRSRGCGTCCALPGA